MSSLAKDDQIRLIFEDQLDRRENHFTNIAGSGGECDSTRFLR